MFSNYFSKKVMIITVSDTAENYISTCRRNPSSENTNPDYAMRNRKAKQKP